VDIIHRPVFLFKRQRTLNKGAIEIEQKPHAVGGTATHRTAFSIATNVPYAKGA
jgi:hypothetical protein